LLTAALTDAGSDTSQAIATAPISSATAFAALSDRSRIITLGPQNSDKLPQRNLRAKLKSSVSYALLGQIASSFPCESVATIWSTLGEAALNPDLQIVGDAPR
jgi:hypothetical protein